MLYLPLATGELDASAAGQDISYEAVNYQFDSGIGLVLFMFKSRKRIRALEASPAEFALGQPAIAEAALGFLRRSLNIKSFAEISGLAHDPAQRRKLQAATGIQPLCVGLDGLIVNFNVVDRFWLTGTDVPDLDTADAEDLSETKPGFVFALSRNRYWSPVLTEEVIWDMVLLQLREIGAGLMKYIAVDWLGVVQRQLGQMATTLIERNAVVWAQEREDVERLDVNFHLFAIEARRFFAAGSMPVLEIVSRDRWDRTSTFEHHQDQVNLALDETHRTIERMTRPLDFREFQMLKTGVEEVEGRIMLLTVLLVVMALFTMAVEPGHWLGKGALLGLVFLIPAGFLLFERWRRSAVARRGRALLTRNRLERVRADIKDSESEIERVKKENFLAENTRQSFLSELNEALERLKRQQVEYEDALKRNRR